MEYPDFLIQAAKCQDDNWTYFQCWMAFDRELMDKWLVEVKHSLAYEPGTNERRFKGLMKEIRDNDAELMGEKRR